MGQMRPITSPATGLELQSHFLMPVLALQKSIETYLFHRPELKQSRLSGRSFAEAAGLLQQELLEKQAAHASVTDELQRLRVRVEELEGVEAANEVLRFELEELK